MSKYTRSDILNLPRIPVSATFRGVYILFDGNEPVYVGQASGHPSSRIAKHLESDKVFDSFVIIPVGPEESLDDVEDELILELDPKYCKRLSGKGKYVTLKVLALHLPKGIGPNAIRTVCENKGIPIRLGYVDKEVALTAVRERLL